MFHQVIVWLAHSVGQWGVSGHRDAHGPGVFLFPFPSEVVIPPAAYLAASEKMNIAMVIFCGTLGSLLGAVFNYWIALKFGRPFFEKYGPYLLVSRHSLEKADRFLTAMGIAAYLLVGCFRESANTSLCRLG
jgi:Uncharacterized membrane-associated protein